MGAVTVHTDGCLKVSFEEHIKVDALKGLRVFVEVTPPAGFRRYNGKVPLVLEISLGMLFRGKAEVTVSASEPIMDRVL